MDPGLLEKLCNKKNNRILPIFKQNIALYVQIKTVMAFFAKLSYKSLYDNSIAIVINQLL